MENTIRFIINADGTHKVSNRGILRALSQYDTKLYIITPLPLETSIRVNYLIHERHDIRTQQYLTPVVNMKGCDLVSELESIYQEVADWNVFGCSINPLAYSKISKYRSGRIGISFTISQVLNVEGNPNLTNYKGLIGSNGDIPSGTYQNGDYFECDTFNFFSQTLNKRLTQGSIAYFKDNAWHELERFEVIKNTTTENVAVDPACLAETPPATEETINEIIANYTGAVAETVDKVNYLDIAVQELDNKKLNITDFNDDKTIINNELIRLDNDKANKNDIYTKTETDSKIQALDNKKLDKTGVIGVIGDVVDLQENKLNKIWTDIAEQTTTNLTDILVFNRGSNVYKTTIANLLDHVAVVELFTVVAELPEAGLPNKIYLVPSSDPETQNTLEEFIWVDNDWERIGGISVDLSNYFTKTEINSMLDDKVDKVSGKGLSTNDYTTTEKNKLDGIEVGAEVNEVNSVNGKQGVVVLNQDDISDGATYKQVSQAEKNTWNNKQDKLVPGYNITIDEDNVISAGAPDSNSYFNYAGSIYGDKHSLFASAWAHSLTVDPYELSIGSPLEITRGIAQYPNGETEGVIIPDGVTTIGANAFEKWLSNNQPLVIPDSVTSIGNSAFSRWESNNQPLVIPGSVTTIERFAFYNWYANNQPLTIRNGVTTIGDVAFGNWLSNNHPLVIPNSVTSIGEAVFQDWTSNNHPLIIPSSVTSIGWGAFIRWSANTHPLIIPSSVTSIGEVAFYDWLLVPYIEIQATTPPTLANANAFNNQNNAPIYVPDESVNAYKTATNWASLANRIFPISDNLTDLIGVVNDVIYQSDTHIMTFKRNEKPDIVIDLPIEALVSNVSLDGDDLVLAFENGDTVRVPLNTLLVGVVKQVNGINADNNGVVNLTIDDIPNLRTTLNSKLDIATYTNDINNLDTRLDNVESGKQDKLVAGYNITIDEDTNVISASGGEVDLNTMIYFNYASNIYGDKYSLFLNAWLHSLTVDPIEISEDSSTSNQRGTAQYPNGETEGVIIPHGVTTIGDFAFKDWETNNQPLVIPDSVTSIGFYAFFGWLSNNHPLVIPNSVTSIEFGAFELWLANNQPLVIPNSVTSIGERAFNRWNLVPYVEMQSLTPPTLEHMNAFGYQGNAPIYVPDESVNAYKTATNWVDLADRIFPISDKPEVMDDIEAAEQQIADLQENKLNKVWTDITEQTTTNLTDILIFNRGSNVYKTTVGTLLAKVDNEIFEVVSVLPTTGVVNKIYLVPSADPKTQNALDEYIWVNNTWEMIGSVSVDLSNYFNKTEINSMLDTIETSKQDKLVAGNNITIDPTTNVISASGGGSGGDGIDVHMLGYMNYAVDIFYRGRHQSFFSNAWEHSFTVDTLEISEDSSTSNQRGTAQYPNGNTDGVIIPHGVTNIGRYAFYGWDANSKPLVIPNSVTNISYGAFYDWRANKHSLTIPNSVTTIGSQAFYQWSTNNQPLIIPDSVTSIGDGAFGNWLQNKHPLVIPNSVTSIGASVFGYWQTNNQPLVIPSSVTSIGYGAFRNWSSNIHPLVIPSSVTTIGTGAFQNWTLVPYVEMQRTTPPTLASISAFGNQNNAPIYVPDESVEAYKTATNWVDLADRIFSINDKSGVIGDIKSALDAILGV